MRLQQVLSTLRARLRRRAHAGPVGIDAVQAAEMATILGPHAETGADATGDAVEPWGLALSGGGIRSATFGLGVLQALARLDLLKCFHYQSSVSGGGYVGAFLQALIRRRGFDAAFAVLRTRLSASAADAGMSPEAAVRAAARVQRPILHLREYSNYLSPHKSPFSGDTLGMVGTYVRNVLLIQLQLCALILALALLPLPVYGVVSALARNSPELLLSLAGLLGMLALALLAYVTTYGNRRPRGREDEAPPPRIALAAVAMVVATAGASLLGAPGLAEYDRLPWAFERAIDAVHAPLPPLARLGAATGLLYFAAWMLWLAFDRWYSRLSADDYAPPSPLQRHAPRFVLATLGAAAFAGLAIVAAQRILGGGFSAGGTLWHAMVLGPSLVIAAVMLVGIVHLGLAGPALSDLQREIWARAGGRIAAAVLLGVSFALALAVYGPWLMTSLARFGGARWASLGWAGALAWLAITGIGLLFAHGRRGGGGPRRAWLLDRVARIAPWVFIFGLLVALSLAGQALLRYVGWPPAPAPAAATLAEHLLWLQGGIDGHAGTLLLVIAAAIAVWLLFAWAVNVNEFSLNAFYRNRLVRCYLGASNEARNPEPTTNFDVQDDLVLADVVEVQRHRGARPLYPLIGAAMNLVAARQLDWQDRKAASFCLSPGFCGHLPPASRPGAVPVGDVDAGACRGGPVHGPARKSLASTLTLGSATAISGAAVSPSMGYHSSPAVTFLLTLFDARLGWWLPNPAHPQRPRADATPFFGRWLLAELFGRTHDGGQFVHLSDGGHFENLGLYELVRRHCRFILCVDAGTDPARAFADLGNAVQKCRVDFGASIDIDVHGLQPQADGLAARSCAVGRIDYADGSRGTLLYLKPTVTGEEPADILHYARTHARFPHEPTSDQYFDEAQFESYRRLGEDIAERALAPVLERIGAEAGTPANAGLGLRDSALKDKLLIALRQRWVAPLPGVAERFARHGRALSRLFATLRDTPALAVLDAQFHPAWSELVAGADGGDAPPPHGPRTRLPAPGDFRACFYFCQELIRLMESVYHDLDLEHVWDHPDNRGWMNAFRHWSGAPIFRIAWTVGMPTFGARFVAFCQQRLQLPRLDNDGDGRHALRIEDVSPASAGAWRAHCERLLADGRIDHLECGMLLSSAMQAGEAPTHLYLLRLRWKAVLARTGNRVPDTTLAIAVLSGRTLRLLRVREHVRRLGLATEFVRLLAGRHAVDAIELRAGHYGAIGVCGAHEAERTAAWLGALLRQVGERRVRDGDVRARRVAE